MLFRLRHVANRVFVEALTGMALGLFATLIVGTIAIQLGHHIPGWIGNLLVSAGTMGSVLTGFGIGIGVAHILSGSTTLIAGTGVAGMVGAHAGRILSGEPIQGLNVHLVGPGEPLGAFLASWVAVEVGLLVSGKTPVDILVTPLATILSGSAVGLLVGPTMSRLMTRLGEVINWSTAQQPVIMGILVSVIMGICLTLPISSAALGIILGLSGVAAGAATVGCCCQMVGFAVISWRDNRWSGLVAQSLGTSMLQMPNIVRKPMIWVPPILASAVLGPVATVLVPLSNNAAGSGMGTSGLVGPIMMMTTMSGSHSTLVLVAMIAGMLVLAPAVLAWAIAAAMRARGLIADGDMTLRTGS